MTQVVERPDTKPEDRDLEELASALDSALARMPDLDPLSRQTATDLRSALDDVHRACLVHIVRTLRADEHGKELLFALIDAPLVRMVLSMHGIIRPDPLSHARSVLDSVRPQLQSHGGDVELVRVDDGVAYVRLSGACNGCSMSAVTMRNGVEKALTEQIPAITAVEVLPNEPGPALIPLAAVGRRQGAVEPGWVRSLPIAEFALGTITPVSLAPADSPSVDAVVVNVGGQLAAYVNACAHLGMPLDDAEIDPLNGTLTCSWHGFCFDALSGECRSLPGTQLGPLPLRVEDGVVYVRAGT